jgi:DNA replication protein DnaC
MKFFRDNFQHFQKTVYPLTWRQTIADAVLDRIVNSSHRIILKGESLRKGKISTTE